MAFYKHKSPTFNVNGINGWRNREIYYYYGNDTLITTGISDNIFETIATSDSSNYKGAYSFLNFFNTGTVLKIRGRLYVTTSGTDAIFNMRVFIDNGTYTTMLASQNGSFNHELTAIVTGMPIDYEIEINSKVDDTDDVYMVANGKYIYEVNSYAAGGANRGVAYVPIYSRSNYFLCGSASDPFTIGVDFVGSTKTGTIEISYLSIEEIQ